MPQLAQLLDDNQDGLLKAIHDLRPRSMQYYDYTVNTKMNV